MQIRKFTLAGSVKSKEILSPVALPEKWGDHRHKITEAVIGMLAAQADWLPADSDPIPSAEFAEVLEALNALESTVREGEFPDKLKLFVSGQVDILRRGIRNYPYEGIAAIERALEMGIGKFVLAKQRGEVDVDDDNEAFNGIRQTLAKFGAWVMSHGLHIKALAETA